MQLLLSSQVMGVWVMAPEVAHLSSVHESPSSTFTGVCVTPLTLSQASVVQALKSSTGTAEYAQTPDEQN